MLRCFKDFLGVHKGGYRSHHISHLFSKSSSFHTVTQYSALPVLEDDMYLQNLADTRVVAAKPCVLQCLVPQHCTTIHKPNAHILAWYSYTIPKPAESVE